MSTMQTDAPAHASDELLQEIRAGLNGVSPGPLSVLEIDARVGGKTFVVNGDQRIVLELPWARETGGNAHRDAAHFARCSPDKIAALIARIASEKAAREAAEAAFKEMEFRAKQSNDAAWKLTEQLQNAEAARDKARARAKALDADLRAALQDIVLALAFIGRDHGTPRWEATLEDVSKMLAARDTAIRAALTNGGSHG